MERNLPLVPILRRVALLPVCAQTVVCPGALYNEEVASGEWLWGDHQPQRA